ncbi:MAG: monovalent cation/H+ antiporter complex subunit F [Bacteroidales bacterium]|jgi:multicomponent Na+:H+ antiporter subunit F|nr:monovalent cation/H+ antiporter complex subunit F [Bacteroidales bacterium]
MVNILLYISLIFIGLAVILSLVRFIKGSSTIDRIISFDVLTIIFIALIVIISYISERVIYLDVALVYGLLSFLAVIIIARYFEKGL